MRLHLLAATGVMLLCCLSAKADIVYSLSDVTLSGTPGGAATDGTLTGTFTTNNTDTAVLSYDITASAAGSFTSFDFTTSDSSVTASILPSQYFQIDSAGSVDELRLFFTSGLSASGGTIDATFSYENEPSGGNRFPDGSVMASAVTPEPSSFILLATGLLGMAGLMRKRLA